MSSKPDRAVFTRLRGYMMVPTIGNLSLILSQILIFPSCHFWVSLKTINLKASGKYLKCACAVSENMEYLNIDSSKKLSTNSLAFLLLTYFQLGLRNMSPIRVIRGRWLFGKKAKLHSVSFACHKCFIFLVQRGRIGFHGVQESSKLFVEEHRF